jgi:hypothetical protein
MEDDNPNVKEGKKLFQKIINYNPKKEENEWRSIK